MIFKTKEKHKNYDGTIKMFHIKSEFNSLSEYREMYKSVTQNGSEVRLAYATNQGLGGFPSNEPSTTEKIINYVFNKMKFFS